MLIDGSGYLSCLHQQIHRAKHYRDLAAKSLAEAKKFADELAAKDAGRAKEYAAIAASVSAKLMPELDDLVEMLPSSQGAGTELHTLLAELGFDEPPNCSCKATMA